MQYLRSTSFGLILPRNKHLDERFSISHTSLSGDLKEWLGCPLGKQDNVKSENRLLSLLGWMFPLELSKQ